MLHYALILIAVISFSPLSADEQQSGVTLEVEKAWARKTRRTMSAAAYMAVSNTSDSPVTITSVSSPIAATASLHRSYEDGGIMKMDHVPRATIAAGETLTLQPGGYHIMLMTLEHPLEEGTQFPVVFHFGTGAEQTIEVTVTGMNGLPMDNAAP